jgi:hypothetical protein
MRFWSEPDRAPNHPCDAIDRGFGDHLESVARIILPMAGRHEVSLAIGICDQNRSFEQIRFPGCRRVP